MSIINEVRDTELFRHIRYEFQEGADATKVAVISGRSVMAMPKEAMVSWLKAQLRIGDGKDMSFTDFVRAEFKLYLNIVASRKSVNDIMAQQQRLQLCGNLVILGEYKLDRLALQEFDQDFGHLPVSTILLFGHGHIVQPQNGPNMFQSSVVFNPMFEHFFNE